MKRMKANPLIGKMEPHVGNGFDLFWRKVPIARLMLLAAPRAFRWIAPIACRSCPAFMALNLFAADGQGMLARRNRKIALVANLTAAGQARLERSSKLLGVAEVVKGRTY